MRGVICREADTSGPIEIVPPPGCEIHTRRRGSRGDLMVTEIRERRKAERELRTRDDSVWLAADFGAVLTSAGGVEPRPYSCKTEDSI